MTARDRLDAIDARANAATPGPWHWRNTGPVYLQGARTRIVMAFARMGMQGAQPQLRDPDGFLRNAGADNLHAHPDTAFIASSRQDVPALVAALRAVLDLADEVVSSPRRTNRWVHADRLIEVIESALGGA